MTSRPVSATGEPLFEKYTSPGGKFTRIVPVHSSRRYSRQQSPWEYAGGVYDCNTKSISGFSTRCVGCFCPAWSFGLTMYKAELIGRPVLGCVLYALPAVIASAAFVGSVTWAFDYSQIPGACVGNPCDVTTPDSDPPDQSWGELQPCVGDFEENEDCLACTDCITAYQSFSLFFVIFLCGWLALHAGVTGIVGGHYRAKLRLQMGGQPSTTCGPWFGNCLMHALICSSPCALCQEARAANVYFAVKQSKGVESGSPRSRRSSVNE